MKKVTIFIFLGCNYLISDPIKKQDIDQNVVNYYFDNNMQDFFNSIPDQPGVSGDPCVYNDSASTCDWGHVCVKAGDRLSDINNYSEFIGHCTALNQADNTSIHKQKALILGDYSIKLQDQIKHYVKQDGTSCDQCVFNRKETSNVKVGSTCKKGFTCIYAGDEKENGWSETIGHCVKDGEQDTCPISFFKVLENGTGTYKDGNEYKSHYTWREHLLPLVLDNKGIDGDPCVFNEKETSKVKKGSTCQNGYYCIGAGDQQENGWSKGLGFCTPAGKPVVERKEPTVPTGFMDSGKPLKPVHYGCGFLYEGSGSAWFSPCSDQCGSGKCRFINSPLAKTTFYAPDLSFVPFGKHAISNLSSESL